MKEENSVAKTNINCMGTLFATLSRNAYKIRSYEA